MSIAKNKDFSTLRVDLHSHTTFSDGALTPEVLIDRACNFQLDVLAITDHDEVGAIDVAQRYITQNQCNITLVPGIEISTMWQNIEIHILGLAIDHKHEALTQLITRQQQARELRATLLGEKLAKCGFDDIYNQAKTLAVSGSLTRAHFAKTLLNLGHVTTMQSAFDKYIGKGKRAYVKPQWCSVAEAIQAIQQAGGTAVIAHPTRYKLSTKWLRRLVLDFKAAAGDGLELVLPQMNNDQKRLMLSFCQEYDLYASQGSDFHSPSRWIDLGRNLTMPAQANPIWLLWS